MKKVEFSKDAVNYVGLYIFNEGLQPKDSHKNHVLSFLALCNYCGEFIPNLSTIAEPLQQLQKKGSRWKWEENQIKSFNSLKELMSQSPVLGNLNFSKPFVLYTHASDVRIGAVLMQEQDNHFKINSYVSRILNGGERNYSAAER